MLSDRTATEYEQEFIAWAESFVEIVRVMIWMKEHADGFDVTKTQLLIRPDIDRHQ